MTIAKSLSLVLTALLLSGCAGAEVYSTKLQPGQIAWDGQGQPPSGQMTAQEKMRKSAARSGRDSTPRQIAALQTDPRDAHDQLVQDKTEQDNLVQGRSQAAADLAPPSSDWQAQGLVESEHMKKVLAICKNC